jgi:hypothetical protein
LTLLSTYKATPKRLSFQVVETTVIITQTQPEKNTTRVLSPQEKRLQEMIEINPKLLILMNIFSLDIDYTAQGHKAPPELPIGDQEPKYPERTYKISEILDIMNNKILIQKAMDMFPAIIDSGLLNETQPGYYYRADSTPF